MQDASDAVVTQDDAVLSFRAHIFHTNENTKVPMKDQLSYRYSADGIDTTFVSLRHHDKNTKRDL